MRAESQGRLRILECTRAISVKRLHPGCLVIAGGYYYAHAVEAALADGNVDVVVRGENARRNRG